MKSAHFCRSFVVGFWLVSLCKAAVSASYLAWLVTGSNGRMWEFGVSAILLF